jgi:hypothetical protein
VRTVRSENGDTGNEWVKNRLNAKPGAPLWNQSEVEKAKDQDSGCEATEPQRERSICGHNLVA